ncbi:MAG: hypothetical protein K6F34_02440 [Lachnospiraceae bacterium]|nr:hypothetical protein [Lachnospiraceae bacterium]
MQGLNVTENGIWYLRECFANYTGPCAYFMLFAAALVYICIKGTKREKQIFVPCSVFLLLTVYNPVSPVILDRFFDVNSEYYRFFWLLPVIVLVPYLMTKLIVTAKDKNTGAVTAVIIAAILLVSGRFVYADGIELAGNIYKMPPELMEVSEMIHDDSASAYPKAMLEYEYNMQMRQYDPKILLTVDREEYMYAVTSQYTDEMLSDETHPQYKLLAAVAQYREIDKDELTDALEATKTQYVVLNSGHPRIGLFKDAGLTEAGRTGGHVVLKYDIKEPYEFELVDYSVVY